MAFIYKKVKRRKRSNYIKQQLFNANNVIRMIQDIIEEIKKINQMIDQASTKDDDFLMKQYQYKRDKLMNELEEELLKLNDFDNWKAWKK